jgi:7,8-dihydropterin-6-yl-methyl-4-(beta-D-ribofuranosyl)aminobenzene 5'-phosphate synthase
MALSHLKITVLAENTVARKELIAEHGLALYIDADYTRGLFDTGQSGALVQNAHDLGLELQSLSWVVLSHGHYDHTGGLESVIGVINRSTVYVNPNVFNEKYVKKSNQEWRVVGMPITRQSIKQDNVQLKCETTPTWITNDILITGTIPSKHKGKLSKTKFFVNENGIKVPDQFQDEQALILQCRQGIVLCVGCSHVGISSIMRYATELTGKTEICGVIGGLHLRSASKKSIRNTIATFREFNVARIGLAHCTGTQASDAFLDALGGRCFLCPVGTTVEF